MAITPRVTTSIAIARAITVRVTPLTFAEIEAMGIQLPPEIPVLPDAAERKPLSCWTFLELHADSHQLECL